MSLKPPKPSNPAARAAPPRPGPAEHVVAAAALRVGQDLVGLVDLLEPVVGARVGVDVRVPLLGELAEGALDLGVGRAALDAEDHVEVAFGGGHRDEKDTGGRPRLAGTTITRWMHSRLTVALTIDHDAICRLGIRRGDSPVKFSHAEFGPRVGAKRIVSCWPAARSTRPASSPGHTLTTFADDTDPRSIAGAPRARLHGWLPRGISLSSGWTTTLDAEVARSRPMRAGDGLPHPTGFRAPYLVNAPRVPDPSSWSRRRSSVRPTTRSLRPNDLDPSGPASPARRHARSAWPIDGTQWYAAADNRRHARRRRSRGDGWTGTTSSRGPRAGRRRPVDVDADLRYAAMTWLDRVSS